MCTDHAMRSTIALLCIARARPLRDQLKSLASVELKLTTPLSRIQQETPRSTTVQASYSSGCAALITDDASPARREVRRAACARVGGAVPALGRRASRASPVPSAAEWAAVAASPAARGALPRVGVARAEAEAAAEDAVAGVQRRVALQRRRPADARRGLLAVVSVCYLDRGACGGESG